MLTVDILNKEPTFRIYKKAMNLAKPGGACLEFQHSEDRDWSSLVLWVWDQPGLCETLSQINHQKKGREAGRKRRDNPIKIDDELWQISQKCSKRWPRNMWSKVGIKTIMKSHECPLEWP